VTRIVADIVDAYVFRRLNARTQFLLLLRKPEVAMGDTWQSIHDKVRSDETAFAAAERAVQDHTGLATVDAYSADYINQFYDHLTDAIVLAPVFAFTVPSRARVRLGVDYADHAWCDREEATARLPYAGQRWAVRHIDEVLGASGIEAELHRLR
jgi:dATP pyrophosphohydrolase